MIEIFERLKHYASLFQIKTPIEIKAGKPDIESDYEVVFLSEQNKAIIRGLPDSLKKDMAEICAMIKLGEKHPLLCTFVFQEEATTDETIAKYCGMFVELCQPLQDAWGWRTIQAYLPEKEFKKEFQKLLKFYNTLKSMIPFMDSYHQRRIQIGAYLTFYALGQNAKLKLLGKGKNRQEWQRYIRALEELALKDPDPHLLTKLPEIANAPYRVNIQSLPHWHYEVRGIN